MTKSERASTDVTLLIDSSGSMASIKAKMESAMKEFIAEQSAIEGDCNLSVWTFPHLKNTIVTQPIQNISAITISPSGGTPLYDAILESVRVTGERLSKMPESARPSKVVFVIITDGEENQSRSTYMQVASTIEHQETKYNWLFMFLGANQDAMSNAQRMGMGCGKGLDFAANDAGVGNSMAIMSGKLARVRGMNTQEYTAYNASGEVFDEKDRKEAIDKKN